MKLNELVDWLNDILEVESFDDVAVNGLQVEASQEVESLAVAVDASTDAVDEAIDGGAQLLICHHGLLWGKPVGLVRGLANKLRRMFVHSLSLYGAHLPLDAHPELGNNACLAKLIGLDDLEPFGLYRGRKIGLVGTLPQYRPVQEVLSELGDRLCGVTGSALYGPQQVQRVAVVSGAAGDMVEEGLREGVELLVSGEIEHSSAVYARDQRFNLAFLGHWATETLGVKALGEAIEREFGLGWRFVGHTTGF